MASLRYIVPALAVIGSAAAASCSVSATTTIQNQGDASALATCTTFSGSIAIATGTTDSIDLSGIQEITGSLVADSVMNLPQLSSSTLNTIGDTFTLNSTTVLSALTFPMLRAVQNIMWTGLAPSLQQLTFTTGISQASSVVIGNTFLNTLQGISLMTVDTLDISNNAYLKTINMPLGNITNLFTVSANADSCAISFPNLIWAKELSINASSLSTPSLQTVNSTFFVGNNRITSYSAPNLTTVGHDLAFINCGMLTNLSFPALTSITGALTVNRTALTSINAFPQLTSIGGALDFEGSFSNASLPSINSVIGSANIQSTSNITSTCNYFNNLASGSSKVIQGKIECDPNVGTPTSGPSGTSGTSSTSSSKSSSGVAVPMAIPAVTGLLGVVAAIFGML